MLPTLWKQFLHTALIMKSKSKNVADLAHIFLILLAKSLSPDLIDHLQNPF